MAAGLVCKVSKFADARKSAMLLGGSGIDSPSNNLLETGRMVRSVADAFAMLKNVQFHKANLNNSITGADLDVFYLRQDLGVLILSYLYRDAPIEECYKSANGNVYFISCNFFAKSKYSVL